MKKLELLNIFKEKNPLNILLFGFILITPIFGFNEYFNIITDRAVRIGEIATPLYIKSIKDLFFIIFLLLSLATIVIKGRITINRLLWYFIATIIASITVSYWINNDLIAILSGIRSFLPLSMLLYAYLFVPEDKDRLIYNAIEYVFVFEFILAIIELLSGSLFGIRSIFGITLSSRLAGTFTTPSSFGLFVSIYWLSNLHYNANKILRYIALLLLILIASNTGIAIAILIGLLYLFNKSPKILKMIVVLLFISMLPMIYFAIPYISGRNTESYNLSGGIRLSIVQETILTDFPQNLMIGTRFGMNSQTYNILSRGSPAWKDTQAPEIKTDSKGFAADSLVAFALGSIGLIPTLLLYWIAVKYLKEYDWSFVILFVTYSLTVNILEAFPSNAILMLIIGSMMGKRSSSHDRVVIT